MNAQHLIYLSSQGFSGWGWDASRNTGRLKWVAEVLLTKSEQPLGGCPSLQMKKALQRGLRCSFGSVVPEGRKASASQAFSQLGLCHA